MFASLHTSALTLARVERGGKKAGAGRLSRLLQLASTRRRLASLDDSALADIGVTREEARREAARPVWDAPASWMR